MKRGGRTHAPYYRVVVVDSRCRGRGREVDAIGYYHPCANPAPVVEVDTEKALAWLARGVRLTDTVKDVFSKKGLLAAHVAGKPAGKPSAPETPAVEAVDAASVAAAE